MTTPPYQLPFNREPIVSQDGTVSRVWYRFFRALFNGTGAGVPLGTAATENTGTSGHTLPFLDGANLWSGIQTIGAGLLKLAGATSGSTILNATAVASGTITVPAATDTLVGKATTDILTNKSLDSGDGTNTVNGRQLVGSATNDSASAGNIGQLIESEVLSGAAVALTTATPADITSISLSAGDWDVWATVVTAPAVGTTTANYRGWISTASATPPTSPNKGANFYSDAALAANGLVSFPVGFRRISVAAGTTVYLSTQVAFAVSTMGAFGYLGARRRR